MFDVCLCVCVGAQLAGQSDQFEIVKAMDFKFDVHVYRDSPDMTPYFFLRKGGVCKNSLGGDNMRFHEHLLVKKSSLSRTILESMPHIH